MPRQVGSWADGRAGADEVEELQSALARCETKCLELQAEVAELREQLTRVAQLEDRIRALETQSEAPPRVQPLAELWVMYGMATAFVEIIKLADVNFVSIAITRTNNSVAAIAGKGWVTAGCAERSRSVGGEHRHASCSSGTARVRGDLRSSLELKLLRR